MSPTQETRRASVSRLFTSAVLLLLWCGASLALPGCNTKRDDWKYNPKTEEFDNKSAPASAPVGGTGTRAKGAEGSMGFSTGGAKDAANFRQNIANNYLPLPADLTYEGLFYDYFFDTGATAPCTKLFCPSYSQAVSRDPVSGRTDYYLTVGLNSGIQESQFSRKLLNLVVVLDISGSMGSSFDKYYYDRFGNKHENQDGETATKMKVATESLISLIGHLKDDDRLGIVLFDDEAYSAKPVNPIGRTDVPKLIGHLREVGPRGSTNMEAGLSLGTELLGEYANSSPEKYENRIIFLTDAMPNTGDTSDEGLIGIASANAAKRIYSTFIGIGVDFNSTLVERITKIQGANYYAVHSSKDFKKRLDEEFDFMVTPLVFDLSLTLEAKGFEISKVYGSPEANQATGELMKVNTLFPSKVEAGETRGGVVLLKLRKVAQDGTLTLRTSFTDRSGRKDGDSSTISFVDNDGQMYANTGIRKAVLLSRYADLLLNWVLDVRRSIPSNQLTVSVDKEKGIGIPNAALGTWERASVPLRVPVEYVPLLTAFQVHVRTEAAAIGDPKLSQEVDLLGRLIQASPK